MDTGWAGFFIGLYVFVLTGCGAGANYYEKQPEVDVLSSEQQEVRLRVLAEADEWLDSGAIVRVGQQYTIEASGQWSGGVICGTTGPDGMGASQICVCRIVPGWSISTLLARINDGVPFAVGNEYTFVATQEGTLQFHINDPPSSSESITDKLCWPYTRDNRGYVTVRIFTPKIKQEIIDVKIVGYDDGVKSNKGADYREAWLNAMRQAIERAGIEIEAMSTVKDFVLEEDYIESRARAVLLPGYEIVDIGYGEEGTYNVMLIGKIKFASEAER